MTYSRTPLKAALLQALNQFQCLVKQGNGRTEQSNDNYAWSTRRVYTPEFAQQLLLLEQSAEQHAPSQLQAEPHVQTELHQLHWPGQTQSGVPWPADHGAPVTQQNKHGSPDV